MLPENDLSTNAETFSGGPTAFAVSSSLESVAQFAGVAARPYLAREVLVTPLGASTRAIPITNNTSHVATEAFLDN